MTTPSRPKAPLNSAIVTAVGRLVHDAGEDARRDPSHSDLDFVIQQCGLAHADPKRNGQTVGKNKRVRAVLTWSLQNNLAAGEELVASLIAMLQGLGCFRVDSPNYSGEQAITNAREAFARDGFTLASDGQLRPTVLEGLSPSEMTDALSAYARRAQQGSEDAALLAGTGKDLLEAVAAHVLQTKWGQYPKTTFPSLLGQAFVALDMATPQDAKNSQFERPIRPMERALYDLGCAVNTLRNRQGTGHGRPFPPDLTQEQALSAVEAIGLVAGYMLTKLKN